MNCDPDQLVRDFVIVAKLAGCSVEPTQISFDQGESAHRATLPAGKMACYVFLTDQRCLKVGKVGSKSGPRFSYQHYDPASSMSNLAKSILTSKPPMRPYGEDEALDEKTVGQWIRTRTRRVNFYLDAKLPVPVLSLLEAFLLCRLNPIFEGKAPT